MTDAVSYSILEDVQTLLQSAGLTGISSDSIRIREIPEASEVIAPVPAVLICPVEEYKTEALGFEGMVDVPYKVEVFIVDATDGVFGVEQKKYQSWAETASNKILYESNGDYRTSLPNTPSVWDIEQLRSPVFDRDKFANNYACTSSLFCFHSNE